MKSVLRSPLLLLVIYATGSCFPKKLEPLPVLPAPPVSTNPASISAVTIEAVYATIATLGFTVENAPSVTEFGFVYSTNNPEPTHTNSTSVMQAGSTLTNNVVTASLFDLKPKTGYFIAPFVKDADGYKYGKAVRIDTKPSLDVLSNPGPNSTGPPTSSKGFIYVYSTLFAMNDDIYAITNGNRQGYGYGALQAFNLSTRQWRNLSFPAVIDRRTDATAFVLQNKGYVGFGTGNATDIHSYQPDNWEQIRSPDASPNVPPFQVVGGIGYSFDGKGYVWNGTWTAKNNPTATLWNDGTYGKVTPSSHIPFWEYNQSSGTWSLIKARVTKDFFATLRQSPFYFTVGDRLYLGGGQNLHDPDRKSEIWELNLKSLEVRSVAKLPDSFVYEERDLSNGNHRNLAAGLQGVGWKRGYLLDVRGNLFIIDVTDANNVKVTDTKQRPGGQGVLIATGDRLFFFQAGQNQQVIELFP